VLRLFTRPRGSLGGRDLSELTLRGDETGLRMLRRGMEGFDVRAVQIGLNKVNEGDQDALEPDGMFGGLTDSAVRRFQEDHGLDVDGIVGPRTRSALFPLVAVSVNVVGFRTRSDPAPSRLQQRIQDDLLPGRLTLGGMTPTNSSGLSLSVAPTEPPSPSNAAFPIFRALRCRRRAS